MPRHRTGACAASKRLGPAPERTPVWQRFRYSGNGCCNGATAPSPRITFLNSARDTDR